MHVEQLQKILGHPNRVRQVTAAVFAVAVVVRIAVVAALWPSWGWHRHEVPDQWNKLAISLIDHATFGFTPTQPTLTRGPVFPLLEVPLYLVFGEHYAGWSVSLLLLDACTCLLAIVLFARLWSSLPALLAGAFCSVHLPVIYYSAKISQVTSMLPFVVIYLFLFSSWEKTYECKWLPWALGLVSGLMILNKTVYLPIPVVCCMMLLWSKWREIKRVPSFLPVVICLLTAASIVAPWTIRNFIVSGGKVIPVQNMFWELFVQDVLYYDLSVEEGNDRPEGRTLTYFMERERQILIAKGVSPDFSEITNRAEWEVAREKAFRSTSLDWIRRDPWKIMRVKVANLWNFWVRAENWNKTRALIAMQIVYLGASVIGFILLFRNRQLHRVKYGLVIIVVLWAEHCLVFAWGRFSLDLVPVLALIFGLGVASCRSPRVGTPY